MLSGILRVAIFLIRVTCLTVSKAFVKSNEKTRTYWLVDSIVRSVQYSYSMDFLFMKCLHVYVD